jgi:thiamine-monophosphate kinase
MSNELHFVARLVDRFGPVLGDDAAVVTPPEGPLLLAVDPVVAGVHFGEGADPADVGWNAVARNVSDIAAMGGRPLHLLVSLVVPAGCPWDLDRVVDGIADAADAFGCAVVGGDTSSGPVLVVTVSVTGTADGPPVMRSGARADDRLFLTGALGATRDRIAPRLDEGAVARAAGATAMIDVSDGLLLDARRLAMASRVGLDLDVVPVVEGGTIDRGEDYELLIAVADGEALVTAFGTAGLASPLPIGRCTDEPGVYRLGEVDLPEGGWAHSW